MSSFSWALEQIRNGNTVRREWWSKGACYAGIMYQDSVGLSEDGQKNDKFSMAFIYVCFVNPDSGVKTLMPWTPSQIDLLTNDWELEKDVVAELSPDNLAMHRAFTFAMKWEGGSKYTNDQRDPGGPTKYGVALTYNKDIIPDKNGDGKINAEDVKLLTEEDALFIYEKKYWVPCKCGLLPDAVGFEYADMCYNIGQGASPKLLQKCLNKFKGINLNVDGKVGPLTVKAAESVNQVNLVKQLAGDRLEYYKTRSGWSTYGKGWTNRTNDCEKEALKLLGV